MLNFLKGKKTYLVAVIFLLLVVLPSVSSVVVPEWVYALLGALGLGAIRAGVQKISGNKGWKTYVAAFAVAVLSVLNALNIKLPLDVEVLYGIFSALGIIGVRDAMKEIV